MKKALERQAGGSHYKDMAIQPVEFCQKNKLNMIESNVIKYVSRHRVKGGREDIEKAIHMLELLLELEYPQQEVDWEAGICVAQTYEKSPPSTTEQEEIDDGYCVMGHPKQVCSGIKYCRDVECQPGPLHDPS